MDTSKSREFRGEHLCCLLSTGHEIGSTNKLSSGDGGTDRSVSTDTASYIYAKLCCIKSDCLVAELQCIMVGWTFFVVSEQPFRPNNNKKLCLQNEA